MELTIINNVYSMFGNFTQLLQKADDLKQIFEGYELTQGKEKLPNGMDAPVIRFVKDSQGFTIRVGRIDLEYANRGPEFNADNFLTVVDDIMSKVKDKFDNVFAQRIAFNQTAFIPNNNGSVIEKLNKAFNVTNIFETPAKEFNIRLNHVKNVQNEDINTILNIQDGRVTNNNTKAEQQVVFVNTDINTLITNTVSRFRFKDATKILPDMILESNEKLSHIAKLID